MSEQHDADEVAQFAALLARLKERTDRSYGQLARRLNMNTSTLHRYCAGETVPVDFAPVERFAALCGATPEERHELHRRWLLAVAARQRSRPQEPAPVPGPAPAPAPAPAPGAVDTDAEANAAPTGEAASEANAAPTGATVSEANAAPTAEAVSEANAAATVLASTDDDDPVTELRLPGPPRPWYRRRQTLVASAAASR